MLADTGWGITRGKVSHVSKKHTVENLRREIAGGVSHGYGLITHGYRAPFMFKNIASVLCRWTGGGALVE